MVLIGYKYLSVSQGHRQAIVMLGDKKISEIMTPAPLDSIESSSSVDVAARLMKKIAKSYLIVFKDGQAVGVITERDIVRRVVAENVDPASTKVFSIMSSPIISVNPDETVSNVAKFLDERGIRRAIVMKKDLILGAVTTKDFVRAIVAEGDKDVQFLRAMMRASAARY